MAQSIVDALYEKNKHIARDVAQYFNDMQAVAKEMRRILVPNGYVCIVIGNTKIKDVYIKSAEVFYEFLQNEGLQEVQVIKRSITFVYDCVPARSNPASYVCRTGGETLQGICGSAQIGRASCRERV